MSHFFGNFARLTRTIDQLTLIDRSIDFSSPHHFGVGVVNWRIYPAAVTADALLGIVQGDAFGQHHNPVFCGCMYR